MSKTIWDIWLPSTVQQDAIAATRCIHIIILPKNGLVPISQMPDILLIEILRKLHTIHSILIMGPRNKIAHIEHYLTGKTSDNFASFGLWTHIPCVEWFSDCSPCRLQVIMMHSMFDRQQDNRYKIFLIWKWITTTFSPMLRPDTHPYLHVFWIIHLMFIMSSLLNILAWRIYDSKFFVILISGLDFWKYKNAYHFTVYIKQLHCLASVTWSI